jgi:hypothetical protein
MRREKGLCNRMNLRGIILFMAALLIFMSGAADAANIGLYGSNSNTDIASLLTTNGHTVTDFGGTAPTPAQLSGLDVLILLRTSGNTDIANFVTGGGLLVTEWDASDWALNTANLLDADDTGGGLIGIGGVPVAFTGAGAALGQGVANPYSDLDRTDYFRNFANIGASVNILATRPGDIPAIIGGASGSGNVLIIGYDWADEFGLANADTRQLILNAVNYQRKHAVPAFTGMGMILLLILAGAGALFFLKRQKSIVL